VSPRQTEIYFELISGKSYSEIAEIFNISTETVKSHCRAIYRYFDVKNQKQLMGEILMGYVLQTRNPVHQQLSKQYNEVIKIHQ